MIYIYLILLHVYAIGISHNCNTHDIHNGIGYMTLLFFDSHILT